MARAMISPKFYAWDRNGKPLAFGKVYTYQARTNTPKPTYHSEDQIVPNTNPVILSGEGYADIYLDGSYKIVVKDSNDNEIWTADPVTQGGGGGSDTYSQFTLTGYYSTPTKVEVLGDYTSAMREGVRITLATLQDSGRDKEQPSTIVSSSFDGDKTAITITDPLVTPGVKSVSVTNWPFEEIGAIEEFVESNELTFQTPQGQTKETITGIERKVFNQVASIPLGDGQWAAGKVYTAYNEYLVYNGVPYKPAASTSLPYTTQGADPTVAPDAGNVVPFVEVTRSDLVTVREDLLGPGTQLYIGGDGESVKVGDTVPAGTTHLRISINSEQNIVKLSTYVSGTVVSLAQRTAEIGSQKVNLENISASDANVMATQSSVLSQEYVDFYQQYQHIIADTGAGVITSADPLYDEVYFFGPSTVTSPAGLTVVCMTLKMQVSGGGSPGDPGQSQIGDGFTRWDIGFTKTESCARDWSPVDVVIQAPSNDYQLVAGGLVHDSSTDRYWLSYTSYKGLVGSGHAQQGTSEDVSPQVFVAYSDDNCMTWTKENITESVKPEYAYMNWCPPTSGCVLDDGTVCFNMSSFRSQGGDVEASYIYKKPGSSLWMKGEVIVSEDEFAGVGGGEVNLFRAPNGSLGAVVRTNTGSPTLYSEQRVYHYYDDKWFFVGSYDTVNCKSGIYQCDTRYGFDKNTLLSTAPHGTNSDNVSGRYNIKLWDALSNTIIGKPHKTGSVTEECQYSDITLMKNGVFLVVYQSNSSDIRGAVFTPNCIAESTVLKMPYINNRTISSDDEFNASFDLDDGALVFNRDENAYKRYSVSAGFSVVDPNTNSLSIKNIDTPVNGTLDVSDGKKLVVLRAGADGSIIDNISAGSYEGDTVVIAVSSGANTTLINESNYSATSINITNIDGNTKLKMNGSQSSQYPSSIRLIWLGSGLGWHTDVPANEP